MRSLFLCWLLLGSAYAEEPAVWPPCEENDTRELCPTGALYENDAVPLRVEVCPVPQAKSKSIRNKKRGKHHDNRSEAGGRPRIRRER